MTQRFIADTTQFVTAVDEATQAVEELAQACVHALLEAKALFSGIESGAKDAITDVLALKTAIASLDGKTVHVGVDTTGAGAGLTGAAADAGATAAAAAATERLAVAERDAASAGAVMAVATRDTAVAADASGAAATRAWRPWFLFGNTWKTALHWIVAGSAEILAVTVPALIALGAGALVGVQGGAEVAGRDMKALWTAFEFAGDAAGKTMGDFLGLGHSLQTAQDAANPGMYEILGSAINDAKVHAADFAQTGLQVVHMLDEFSARITVDFQAMARSGQFQSLLGAMVPDLQELGQVFGNLGHAILNFAAAMPGLAELLLKIADGASHLILAFSSLPTGLIMSAMALEEFYRWGGLVLGVVARLADKMAGGALFASFAEGGGFVTRFGAALKTLGVYAAAGIMNLGGLITKMAAVTGAGAEAGAAIEGFGASMGTAIAGMSPLAVAGIAGLVAAVAVGVVAISRIKDATDRWVASTDRAVASASDLQVLPRISQTLAANQIKLADATQRTNTALKEQGTQTAMVSARFGPMNGATQRAAQDAIDLTLQQQRLISTARTVATNVANLAGAFHVSAAGALALANAAGVNLQIPMGRTSEAMKIAVQQIRNLETGLGALNAPAGMVGADMQALGVQSQLAGTKVGQVNQAMDQFIGTTTGGMGTLSQFEGALNTMGHDAQSASVGIDGAIRSISRSATQMGFTLQGFGPKAQQSWQQFSQAVQQGNSVLDVMRTGMAEGVVSGNQLKTAIRDVAGQLLPFAAHSRTARAMVSQLAQEAGFPATTSLKRLAQQLGVTGDKAKGQLVKGVEQAIIKMSNLNQVARNLSATVSNQLSGAMAGAVLKASGLKGATDGLVTAISKYGAKSPQAAAAQQKLNNAQVKANTLTNQVANAYNKTANSATKLGSSTGQAATAAGRHVSALDKQIKSLNTSSGKVTANAQTLLHAVGPTGRLTDSTGALGNKMNTTAGHVQNASGKVQGAGGQAGTASGKMNTLSTSTQRVGTQANTSAGALNRLHTATGGASSAAAGATGRMFQLSVSEGRVGTSAYNAAAAVRQLAAAINSLHSKTINVTTVTSTVKANASGTLSATPGVTLVGERGPELVYMRGGEQVVPANRTSDTLAALASAGAAGGGGHVGEVHVHSHAYIDGKEVFNSVRTESYKFQTRNAGARTGLLIPGNQVGRA